MSARYVFVREDASVPSLAPLDPEPYLVFELQIKFFRLQLGSMTDMVSVDRIKPAFSDDPISAALPLLAEVLLSSLLYVLWILRLLHPPAPSRLKDLLRELSSSSFRHLFLLGGTLTGLYMTEGSAPTYLPYFCGGLMSAHLFLNFKITRETCCAE